MTELFSEDRMDPQRRSSKGNQLKFARDGYWYKTDYLGYEGLAEYVVSKILAFSSLRRDEFVDYELEKISWHGRVFPGCRSRDFSDGWQLITLERLFQQEYGAGVNQVLQTAENSRERLQMLVNLTERATGLSQAGIYFSKMLTIDAFFLNEDRHSHNIAFMTDQKREYRFVPFFDQGAGLLSDTAIDYPLDQDVYQMIPIPRAKTFCADFDEQMDTAEELYGNQLRFHFSRTDAEKILQEAEDYYSEEVRTRVLNILMQRKRKYQYLFDSDSE